MTAARPNPELLCGHWTFFGADLKDVARCDMRDGHNSLHRCWTNPGRGESFRWADRAERHDRLAARSPSRTEREEG